MVSYVSYGEQLVACVGVVGEVSRPADPVTRWRSVHSGRTRVCCRDASWQR